MAAVSETFDVIVLGAGPGGEVLVGRLVAAGKRVALVERELIGGECGYWACIPSKTLLRPPEVRAAAANASGVATPYLRWTDARDWRDVMVRNLDDTSQVDSYQEQGVTVVKGAARFTGPGTVEVDGRTLQAPDVVVATGSDAAVPPIEGLEQAGYWTNREATTLDEIPARALVLGGGPVGIETSTYLSRYGAKVTLVQHGELLLGREEPRVGELVREHLEADGVTVVTGRSVEAVRGEGATRIATLDDGKELSGEVVVVATGRRPRSGDLALDTAGIDLDGHGAIPVDEHCRAGDGVWAIGDVTGVMPFTHVAKYQARIVADNLLGGERTARYEGIPRVVFADPEVAAVGMTAEQARAAGVDLVTTELDLAATLARPSTYEREPRGVLGLLADSERGVLVGAWAVAPMASEWIHTAALGIRAALPITVLADTVPQFPTYSEGLLTALEQLDL